MNKGKETAGGLLLVFCVILGIVGPLLSLGDIGSILSEYGDYPPSVKRAALVDIFTVSFFIFLGIYTAYQLFTLNKIGLVLAKIYLVTVSIRNLITSVLWHSSLPDLKLNGVNEILIQSSQRQEISSAMNSIFISAIWYSYLVFSKRVKKSFQEGK